MVSWMSKKHTFPKKPLARYVFGTDDLAHGHPAMWHKSMAPSPDLFRYGIALSGDIRMIEKVSVRYPDLRINMHKPSLTLYEQRKHYERNVKIKSAMDSATATFFGIPTAVML